MFTTKVLSTWILECKDQTMPLEWSNIRFKRALWVACIVFANLMLICKRMSISEAKRKGVRLFYLPKVQYDFYETAGSREVA